MLYINLWVCKQMIEAVSQNLVNSLPRQYFSASYEVVEHLNQAQNAF